MVEKIAKVGLKLREYFRLQLVLKYKTHLILKKSIYYIYKDGKSLLTIKKNYQRMNIECYILQVLNAKVITKQEQKSFFLFLVKGIFFISITRLYVN